MHKNEPDSLFNRLMAQRFYNNFKLYDQNVSTSAPLVVNSAGIIKNNPEFQTNLPNGRVDYYLLYLLEGSMPFSFLEKNYRLLPGSFVIIPPRCAYRYHSIPGSTVKYFFIHFTGFWAKDSLARYGFGELPYLHHAPPCPDVIARFQALLQSFSPQKTFLDAELAARADSLLRALARLVLGAKTPDRINRSLTYIDSHYSQNIQISELAKLEFLSPSRYITIFHEIMGVTPAQYLIRVRLNAACVLLRETSFSGKEIGAMVGYEDPHYFNALFKRHIGMTPGLYRKQKT